MQALFVLVGQIAVGGHGPHRRNIGVCGRLPHRGSTDTGERVFSH